MTTEQRAFLASIRDDLKDDTVRMVYADWLDENGDPERAEFIRLQVRLRQLASSYQQKDIDREYGLLLRNWNEWLGRPKWVKKTKPWNSDFFEPAINFQPRPCRPHRGSDWPTRDRPMVQVVFYRGFAWKVDCDEIWWAEHHVSLEAMHPGVSRDTSEFV